MAQTILCDNAEGHAGEEFATPAAVLITRLDDGDVTAFCGPCFIAMSVAVARDAESRAAPEAPAATDDQGDETDDENDEDAIARLNALGGAPADPTESGQLSDAGAVDDGGHGSPDDAPKPASKPKGKPKELQAASA